VAEVRRVAAARRVVEVQPVTRSVVESALVRVFFSRYQCVIY